MSVRRGLSLVEMLASLVITLIVMAATVQLFGTVTNAINFGRAGLETNDRVRSVVQKLRTDVRNVTCDTIPGKSPKQLVDIWKSSKVRAATPFRRTQI